MEIEQEERREKEREKDEPTSSTNHCQMEEAQKILPAGATGHHT